MATQEIIVYRNPVEAMIWDSIASGQALPILVWIVLFFVMIFLSDKYFKKSLNKYSKTWIISAMLFSALCSWLLMKFIY